jgi:predicted transcriptional regulator
MNQIDQHRWMKLILNSQFFEKRMKVMSQTTLEMTKELVIAQIEAKALSPDEVQTILRQTHAVLMHLQAQEAGREVVPESVAWKKSVTRHTITCLECGVPFKQLSGRHLKRHGLNARSYRAKYDIPWTQPLAAKDTTTRRKQLVQRIRPWEKAPQFVKAQQRKNRKVTETPKRARTRRAQMAHA